MTAMLQAVVNKRGCGISERPLTSLVGKPDFSLDLDRCGNFLGNPHGNGQASDRLVVWVFTIPNVRDIVIPGCSLPPTLRVLRKRCEC